MHCNYDLSTECWLKKNLNPPILGTGRSSHDRATSNTIMIKSWAWALPCRCDLPVFCFPFATACFVTADHTPPTGLEVVIPGFAISKLIFCVLMLYAQISAVRSKPYQQQCRCYRMWRGMWGILRPSCSLLRNATSQKRLQIWKLYQVAELFRYTH